MTMHIPELHLDASKHIGEIRPLNGVNLFANVSNAGNEYQTYADLHAACARMHDAPLTNPGFDLIDISRIFPLFHLDANDAKNYRFEETDFYLQKCFESGTPIYYRLGESIDHSAMKYRIHPPQDYEKWVEICSHIIAHYNEGWANGFHFDIKYWEIWNEPDAAGLWTGTQEQFAELYICAARILKARYPHLKIGGPGHIGDDLAPVHTFLKAVSAAKAPLDFYSWHCYGCNIEFFRDQVKFVRELVDSYGFQNSELHLNEWHFAACSWSRIPKDKKNYVFEYRMKHLDAAAFLTAVLIEWQDTALDMGCYYTGCNSAFGLYSRFNEITKSYCAMKAVGLMNQHSHRLAIEKDNAVYSIAGENDDGEIAVLLAVYPIMGSNVNILLDFEPKDVKLFSIDEVLNLEPSASKYLGNETVVPIGGKPVTYQKRIIVPIGSKPSVHFLTFRRG